MSTRTPSVSFLAPLLAVGLLLGLLLALLGVPLWLFYLAPLLSVPVLVRQLRRLPDSSQVGLEDIWRATLERLQRLVPESTFRIWLEPLRPVGAEGEVLYLTAPSTIRGWVERRYASLIAEALADSGSSLRRVAFKAELAGLSEEIGVQLNPNYTFDRFVIGPGNRLAHGAALTVAEAPSEAYNPLFLHGPPGVGKTHLLGAIANYLGDNAPGLNVRYTTAESFTLEFVAALRESGADAFKLRYRDIDVLLVDSVQYLEGKQTTEREFLLTLEALYESGSQLVFSSDRLPGELASLSAPLRERFDWGLTVAIERPDLASRLLVLRRLVAEAGIEVKDTEALAELARRIDANPRQLHGALTRVIAHASLMQRPINSELIADVIPQATSREAVSVEEIQQQVAERFGVTRSELIGASRAAAPLRAREVAIFLTRDLTDFSLPQIGRLHGGRDHSTVLGSLRQVEATLAEDPELARLVEEVRRSLRKSSAGVGRPDPN